jgi:parvulin-like peptidyl-prolyl isomerase
MRLLREPILHFALAGAVLFGLNFWLNAGKNEDAVEPVRIGAGDVEWVKDAWSKLWLRQPTESELEGLINELIEEQLLAREAVEMGLDKNDTIVRRRLAQKLKFLVEDTSRLIEPTDDRLREFYSANPSLFLHEPKVTFIQIFFDPSKRRNADGDAASALAKLSNVDLNRAFSGFGDRLLIEGDLADGTQSSVANVFGPEFMQAVFTLAPKKWSGPIKSGYGAHLVYVSELSEGVQRSFEEARADVLLTYRTQMRESANKEYTARLREKYGVVIDADVHTLINPKVTAR